MAAIAPEEYDNNARAYLLSLKAGQKPTARPDCGPWTFYVAKAERAFDRVPAGSDPVGVMERFFFQLCKQHPDVARLLRDPALQEEDDTNMPALLPEVALPVDFDPMISEGYRLLQQYAEHSLEASPEGFKDFHLFGGIYAFSTAIARRAYIPTGASKLYSNVSIAFCAKSTAYAKSTTAKIAESVLQQSGLGALLVRSRKLTPEKLIHDMSGKWVPTDYPKLDADKQEHLRLLLARSGQKGMYWDEFGKFLKSMMQERSPMAGWSDVLLQLDASDAMGSGTVGRGDELVEKPYLSVLGSLVTNTLKNVARSGSELWQDGFFARVAFVTAPDDEGIDAPVDLRWIPAPAALVKALHELDQALGIPECSVNVDDDGKPRVNIITELPEYECQVDKDAERAWQRYRSSLKKMASQKDFPDDLHASYGRLATTALRMAMIFATIENRHNARTAPRLTLTHWRVAQYLAELLRRNLHRFYEQVNGYQSPGARQESDLMAIIEKLATKGQEWVSPTDVQKYLKGKLSIKEISDIMESLKEIRLDWRKTPHAKRGLYRLKPDSGEHTTEEQTG